MDFSVLFTSAGVIGLISLTFMEIILGIDNIIFISIVAGKLPPRQARRARNIGLLLALVIRLILLMFLKWIVGLTYTVIEIPQFICKLLVHMPTSPCVAAHLEADPMIATCGLSWRDLILLGGGLFLIWKSISEIQAKFSGHAEGHGPKEGKGSTFALVVVQIVALDIVFSFDSILTAIGLTDQLVIMIAAVLIAVSAMLLFADAVSSFVNKRPSMKILALSFLILIGFMLVLEALNQHIDKGYVYFAMAFAFIVEIVNSRLRRKVPHQNP